MPIIVDTNCFANVFCRTSQKHKNFEPVLKWIIGGKGQLVYGGTKYKKELTKARKYLTFFRLLKESGKAISGNDSNIDKVETEIEAKKDTYIFNDAHLLAISIDTKCCLICSEDTSSIPFVTDKKYLPKGASKPIYYTSEKNSDLLCDKYVHKDLRPLCKINKELAIKLYGQLPDK